MGFELLTFRSGNRRSNKLRYFYLPLNQILLILILSQGCGCPGVWVSDRQCHTLICNYRHDDKHPIVALDSIYLCDGFFDCENQEDEAGCEKEVEFECKMGPADKAAQSGRLPQLYICDGYVNHVILNSVT